MRFHSILFKKRSRTVKDCLDIQVGMGQGHFEEGKLVAKDPTNDLALLKVNAKPARVGAHRFARGRERMWKPSAIR